MTSIQQLWLLLGGSWAMLEMAIVYKTRLPCRRSDRQKYRSEKLIWVVVIASLIAALAFKQLHLAVLPIDYFQRQAVALILLTIGLTVRFYAVLSLGRFFSTTATTQSEHVLIDRGPYHLIRHPAYTGLLIGFFSAGLAMGDLIAILSLLCPVAYVLNQRIRVEEQVLIEHFGPVYDDYRFRTKKLIPWLY
ncbi:isoprenylcysteine carboxylmethyltransferase family protein [Methylobacter sp. Wu8]|jgi:protein-S-isoprenylcysteine O-methyltransferase Ste14|uniref:Protein-S-isoprenylcysteine O-methyltransferase Ste14 n=1 Tax=Methylobacter tundripaludum TaxID=173365 RepID=A0A2S6H024_9GAMM|nr:isoprenylcysteine carboxylmethyltransferase family protein [Methylobacter tundripaludum]MCK9634679.1 isoprenylcysteine carboxylmethyltransferase family protein [Methylobacter tundripaludum]PPK70776.1 protein-S-isoprenylcysteine O-methyltransferase Ste14 [Methylobacter tundripaludum]